LQRIADRHALRIFAPHFVIIEDRTDELGSLLAAIDPVTFSAQEIIAARAF
jgi:hypothetical protein